MEEKKFSKVATFENSTKWKQSISRRKGIYKRDNDIRSEFLRDYNRILHCMAYRRLKHKTQVFFATGNDHICTRIEHVNHVSSVSYTIANFLGLNTELTAAIAIGHDLGHAPFGHEGEKIIGRYVTDKLKSEFWHEKNSLRFVDSIETLTDPDGKEQNLNLTYAVRDGIICHCGEVKSTAIYPREDNIDLNDIQEAGQVSPFTWEGCIVKIADKISYLGRDIEDAFTLQILHMNQLRELHNIVRRTLGISNIREINNTVLMHNFMIDLCENSNPEKGIVFSSKYLEFIEMVKDFNYKNIYYHKRLGNFKKYAELVLNTIIETLEDFYDVDNTILNIKKNINIYPVLTDTFQCWLYKYCLNI
jgi:dGTPase